MKLEFTCAICTHARATYLEACLESLAAQKPGVAFHTIVVDSASGPEQAIRIADLARRFGAELVRLDETGLSRARNAALARANTEWIAYIDDDAQAATDWSHQISLCLRSVPAEIAVIGGRILPAWEAPMPSWWRDDDLGYLTIITAEAKGIVGEGVPSLVQPAGANILFNVGRLLEIDGFDTKLGRSATNLISHEETLAMERLIKRGYKVFYDSAIVVFHSIQASRLNVDWLISRIHWGTYSDVVVAHLTGSFPKHLRHVPRRLIVTALSFFPTRIPVNRSMMLTWRRRYASSSGELRGILAVFKMRARSRQA